MFHDIRRGVHSGMLQLSPNTLLGLSWSHFDFFVVSILGPPQVLFYVNIQSVRDECYSSPRNFDVAIVKIVPKFTLCLDFKQLQVTGERLAKRSFCYVGVDLIGQATSGKKSVRNNFLSRSRLETRRNLSLNDVKRIPSFWFETNIFFLFKYTSRC